MFRRSFTRPRAGFDSSARRLPATMDDDDAESIALAAKLRADAEARATARLAALLAVPGDARVRAKAQLRRGAAEALRTSQAEDLDEMVTMLTRAEVQERIQSYLESLSSKRAGSSP